MARPIKQKVDYFPHYVKGGKTLFILEEKYGNDGYAFWFKLLEVLCDSDGHFIDCRNLSNWEFLLAKTHTDAERAEEIISTLVNLGKIDAELWAEKVIWVQSLLNNVSSVYERRRENLPVKPNLSQAIILDEVNKCEQKPTKTEVIESENRQSRVKESKGEKSIVEESKDIIYPFRDITALWNSICKSLPQVKALNDDRRKKIKSRLLEMEPNAPQLWLDRCRALFERVQASPFLTGDNQKGWTASFDWLFSNGNNWVKVMEGNYDHGRSGHGQGRVTTQEGITLGVGEYIETATGRRTYGTGRATIPPTAPPRPSERHSWDGKSQTWILL